MAARVRITKVACGLAAMVGLTLVPLPPGPAMAAMVPQRCPVGAAPTIEGARLPDIRTVVPQQLNLVNAHQKEILRFSNLIANTGEGPWRMRPEFPLSDPSLPQKGIQQVLNSRDSSGRVLFECEASTFEYHPTHRHWHTGEVAKFEIRMGSPTGPVYKDNEIKTTFCLIDWVSLTGSSTSGKNTARTYFDCAGAFHGISVGWTDQYHHATDGQELDITDARPGLYYLVSISNPENRFVESDYTNNVAYQGFQLTRDSRGNPKIKLTNDRSFCSDIPGLCGEQTANR